MKIKSVMLAPFQGQARHRLNFVELCASAEALAEVQGAANQGLTEFTLCQYLCLRTGCVETVA
jgi:hypothetical protein